ncbi:PTS lactose transporter subunit IIB [Enterococcus villorum]|uniref:PTS lactose transporter subunit IIB n=2 Tax=Enterococcus villorum TaxID=112904 RepID=A0A1V8YEL0_9ENTE|nr:PTS sugar transporter subunit IIB [Enterococcus villorum]EOH89357.1 PTS system ascorbate-specific transporter subunit IIB [Enterococcus villorum ATCC 700913]EOW76165.1 PTS system ascorbate-specific transporter subunit IIB [Enterococcus villorum ATCC 700913]OQO71030.1 PTS lactose transporter subunit IIB [Enterococcus villorum]OQO76769.1 PTS lactose transporter subunit IIB [Enterococcus villorum]GEL91218.1 PTS lactose transporter subunit IIB [Enterococcus villorum]
MRIVAVCQSGLGTSFMVEMNIKQALQDLGQELDQYEVSHTDVGSVSNDMADYFFIEYSLKDTLYTIPEEKLIALQSIIDGEEVKEKVAAIIE